MKRIFAYMIFPAAFLFLACGGGKEATKKEAQREQEKAKKEVVSKKVSQTTVKKEKTQATTSKKTVEKTQKVAQVEKKETVPSEKPAEVPVEKKPVVATVEHKKDKAEKAKLPVKKQKMPDLSGKEELKQIETKICNLLKLQNALIEDIYFDPGEYQAPSLTFNSNYIVTLAKIVKVLKSDGDIKVRLYGHSDASGDEETNLFLSQERCKTVANLILSMFDPRERKDIATRIEIVPVGSKEPLVSNVDKSKSFINRRVSIELTYEKKKKGQYFADIEKTSVVRKKVREFKPSAEKVSRKVYNPDDLYKMGMEFLDQKKYEKAIATFNKLISHNPEHNLADNAQWWIGEAYYFQGKYRTALNAYKKVFALGDGNKSAYAQLRIGYCYLKLGNKTKAIEEFEKVIDNYPAAKEEVAKAKAVLKSIRGY